MAPVRRTLVSFAAFFSLAAAATTQLAAAPAPDPTSSAAPNLSQNDARAVDLLRAAMNADRATSYVAQVQTIRFGASGSVATIAREEHRAPNETHKIYLAPENLYGDSMVMRDGDTYSYDAAHQRLVVSHNPPPAPEIANGNLGLLLANYRPVIGEPEMVAGRPTLPCSLVNRFTGERVMRLWIDAETRLILQKETYHANGTIGSRMQFENIRYTNAIPPGVFATPIPQGYNVVRTDEGATPSSDVAHVLAAAGFNPAGPHYLPEGFTIVSADVTTVKGIKTLHLLYSDGIRSLSLFENASNAAPDFGHLQAVPIKIGAHDARYVNEGTTTLLSWKDKGLVFALVGDLDVKDLTEIAGSVS